MRPRERPSSLVADGWPSVAFATVADLGVQSPPPPPLTNSTEFTIIGIALVLVGTMAVSVGFHLWNWSHETGEGELPILKRWRWWAGTLCVVGLTITTDTISYSMLPLSVIASFGALPIVFSAIISSSGCLGASKEKIGPADVLAFAIIICGVIMVGCTTISVEGARRHLDGFAELFGRLSFVLTGSILLVASAGWFLVHTVPALRSRCGVDAWSEAWPVVMSAALTSSCAGITQAFMKAISEIMREIVEGEPLGEIASKAITWVTIAGVVSFALANLLNMQLLLGRGRAVSLALPAYQALCVLSGMLCGVLLLEELAFAPHWGVALLVAGIGIDMVGLSILGYRQQLAMRERRKDEAESNGKEQDGQQQHGVG